MLGGFLASPRESVQSNDFVLPIIGKKERIENRNLLAPGKSAGLAKMKKKGNRCTARKHYVLGGQGRKRPLKELQVNENFLSEARDGCGQLLLDET